MNLDFTDVWHSPYSEGHALAGGGTYYRKLNGIPAEIFSSASYLGTSLPGPEIKGDWLEFVGGFTDEYFFNKGKIEKLSDEDKVALLEHIKAQKKANKGEVNE